MAQHTGTAGRSGASAPASFVAGSLFAVAAVATVLILGMALGMRVTVGDQATAAEAVAPAVGGVRTYDGRLDPIEEEYIRSHAHGGYRQSATPGSPDISVGPINQYVPVDPGEGLVVATQHGGVLYRGIPNEAPVDRSRRSNGTRLAQ
jgi:hypothetical protein